MIMINGNGLLAWLYYFFKKNGHVRGKKKNSKKKLTTNILWYANKYKDV